MLRLWLYCSYTGSPVGFQLGFVDFDAKEMEKDTLTFGEDEADPLLKRCFFTQGVHGAEGRVPEKNIYILVKKLPVENGDGVNLNVNFAWETNNLEWFQCIHTYFRGKEDKEIFSKISTCLIADESEIEFGFHFDRSKLCAWKNSIIDTPPNEECFKGFKIRANMGQSNTLSGKLRLEKIYPNKGYQVKPIVGDWYSIEQGSLSADGNMKKKFYY